MTLRDRMLELSSQGFACAQIMVQLVLDVEEKENVDLIRCMDTFNNGIRDTGLTCGAFTGGACVISYYAGKGKPDELPDPNYDRMIHELFAWFKDEATAGYGGITCHAVLDNGKRDKMSVCPGLVEETFNKALELLDEYSLLD